MSSADEILKLKELLDNNIITQEEFEKKKKELLNSEVMKKDSISNNNSNNSMNYKTKKKLSIPTIIIGVFIFLIVFGIAISSTATLENQIKDKIGLSEEKAKKIVTILNDCGISYGTITRNSTLDTENGKAYNISMDSDSNIGVMKIKGNNLYSLRMTKIDNKDNEQVLYKDNKKIASLSNFIKDSKSTKSSQQQANKELLAKYSVSYEETDKIIKECGFSDYTLEYVGEENEIHYFIIR